jgi:coenzyme F420 hydrogenase subunit beta
MNKTFFNLIQDVQKTGRCHHCGGCVTFCSSINLGALEMDDTGKPRFRKIENCLDCGLCYMICPETQELDQAIKENADWTAPFGRQISLSISQAADEKVQNNGTDGGVVTAILLHLFDTGRINGAIVSKSTDAGRVPFLATTRQAILDSAGSCFHASHGLAQLADTYSTYSPSLDLLSQKGGRIPERLAFVGTPCQVNTLRKMQAMGIVPSDAVDYVFGLFCSGNFSFDAKAFASVESRYRFRYADVEKINIKEDFLFTLTSGRTIAVGLDELDHVKREACHFCNDFGAEYADISFGGLGAAPGWTTAVTRSPQGKEVMASAMGSVLTRWTYDHSPNAIVSAEKTLETACLQKQQKASAYMGQQAQDDLRIVY